MECKELEAESQAQYAAVQQQIDQLWQRLIRNDSDVVLAVLSHAFQTRSAHAAPLGVWDAEVQLALLARDLAAPRSGIPGPLRRATFPSRKFTKTELADLYRQLGLVLTTAKEAFALAPGVTDIRIVALRNTPADACGKLRPEAILATGVARVALNGVQWTRADALTILNGISSELVTRIAGPSKGFVPLVRRV
jgi:hypothetical protein